MDHVWGWVDVYFYFHVLSNSVAEAMEFLGNPESKKTIRFIKILDRWFDILNVRNSSEGVQKRKPDRMPIHRNDPRLQVSYKLTFPLFTYSCDIVSVSSVVAEGILTISWPMEENCSCSHRCWRKWEEQNDQKQGDPQWPEYAVHVCYTFTEQIQAWVQGVWLNP